MTEKNHNMYILAIVAIVAVVSIISMLMHASSITLPASAGPAAQDTIGKASEVVNLAPTGAAGTRYTHGKFVCTSKDILNPVFTLEEDECLTMTNWKEFAASKCIRYNGELDSIVSISGNC